MGNIINPKKNKNKYSYINNDNLLLSNIQERLDNYEENINNINNTIRVIKSNYFLITKDFRTELIDLKKDYNYLEQKCLKIEKEYRIILIINKNQKQHIKELEYQIEEDEFLVDKIHQIEEDEFLVDKIHQIEEEEFLVDKIHQISESSQYLDSE